MNLKDKILFILIGMFFISAVANILLVKYKVQINFIDGGAIISSQTSLSAGSEASGSQTTSKSFFGLKSAAIKSSDFYTDFENGSTEGWKGKITKEIVPQNSKFALVIPKINNRYFASGASKVFEKGLLKIGANTCIEFDYYIKDGSAIYIQSYNPTQRDNFFFNMSKPEVGEWKTASIGFAAFKDNSYKGKRPQRGDEFSNINIYGGKAGEDTLLVIDNFKIIDAQ